MKKIAFIIVAFVLVVTTSCTTNDNWSHKYETAKAKVLNDNDVKAYFKYVEISRKTLSAFTSENPAKANEIVRSRTNSALSNDERDQLRKEMDTFKNEDGIDHKTALAKAQYHYLKAYKRYIKSGKISKETFGKILSEEIAHKHTVHMREIEAEHQAAIK